MMRYLATAFVLAATAFVAPQPTSAGYDTYLALGDSLTFGVGSPQFAADGQHDGDRGYVGIVADRLANQNGGVRPNLVNLAISGETTDSFLGNALGFPNIEGPNAGARNTTYAALGLPANQFAAMNAELDALAAAGHSVDLVTMTLGSNDLFALVGYATANNLNPADLLPGALQNISNNLAAIFSVLEAKAPSARIDVLGTYNPLPADPLYAGAVAALNLTVEQTILGFSANAHVSNLHFIDVAPLFVGRETELTYIASLTDPGNVHPTPEGYSLMAGQIASVPEPSSLVLLGFGSVAMVGLAFRRRVKAA